MLLPLGVIECVSEKLEHCIKNITKIDDTIQEAIIQAGYNRVAQSGDDIRFLSEYIYLHSHLQSLLICLHKEHCKWQDKLTASLLVSDDFTSLTNRGSSCPNKPARATFPSN